MKKDRDLPKTWTIVLGSFLHKPCRGLRAASACGHQAQKTFLWSGDLGKPVYQVQAKLGNQIPNVLPSHSLERLTSEGQIYPAADFATSKANSR